MLEKRARAAPRRQRQLGVTLVELVLAIVIVSVAVVTLLGVMGLTSGRSADPLLQRQSLAIAESLLQEILSQPYTAIDLDGGTNAIGPEAGETRGSASTPFDHVDDYHGYSMNGIVRADGTAVPGLARYSAAVTVTPQELDNIGAGEGLLVTVTVIAPGGSQMALRGFKARLVP